MRDEETWRRGLGQVSVRGCGAAGGGEPISSLAQGKG